MCNILLCVILPQTKPQYYDNTNNMIKILKPRKQDDGTYFAEIALDKSKNKYVLQTNSAYVRSIKQVIKKESDDEDSTYSLLLKQDNVVSKIYDLNEQVVTCVKENCMNWFKAKMTDALIEEYFVNTVTYDKKGRFLKFRCVNDISSIPENTIVNIQISLQGLRFYKQMFLLEWVVEEVEIINDTSEESLEEEEDIPYPSEDDLKLIKDKYTQRLSGVINDLRHKIVDLEKELNTLETTQKTIAKCKTIEDATTIFESLEI